MIGKITGRVEYVAADHALIEAAGVGYVVHCAPATLASLPAPGEAAALYTELVVREDLMQLLGFRTPAEREWHRLLTSVQGVGAKVAMGILGALGPEGVSRALALGDAGAVRAAPGVGPKLAQRIVNELKEKAPEVVAMGHRAAAPAPPVSAASQPAPAGGEAEADALSALVNLGYDRRTALRAVMEAGDALGEARAASDLIRAALNRLAPAER